MRKTHTSYTNKELYFYPR